MQQQGVLLRHQESARDPQLLLPLLLLLQLLLLLLQQKQQQQQQQQQQQGQGMRCFRRQLQQLRGPLAHVGRRGQGALRGPHLRGPHTQEGGPLIFLLPVCCCCGEVGE